jgi:hypothetical protein
VPHAKTCDTFRATDCTAVGAGLGSPSFVGLNVSRPVPSGFVSELRPQHRPTRIEDGLSHPSFREFGRADITNDDQFVFASEPRAPLVKMVTTGVGDLGVDRADAALISSTLRNGERGLMLAVGAKGRNGRAIAACGKRLEPEVDADLAATRRQIVSDFALETDVPASPGVLNEAARLKCPVDLSRLPEAELASEVDDVRAVDLHRARDKRNPAKRPLRAIAGAEARAPLVLVSGDGKLATYRLHGIRVQTEFGGAPGAEFDQVKCRRPTDGETRLAPPFGLALRSDAEVPHLVAGPSVAIEVLSDRRVLDAEFECENAHRGPQAVHPVSVKSASLGCNPAARSRFVPQIKTCNNGRLRADARTPLPPRPERRGFSGKIL